MWLQGDGNPIRLLSAVLSLTLFSLLCCSSSRETPLLCSLPTCTSSDGPLMSNFSSWLPPARCKPLPRPPRVSLHPSPELVPLEPLLAKMRPLTSVFSTRAEDSLPTHPYLGNAHRLDRDRWQQDQSDLGLAGNGQGSDHPAPVLGVDQVGGASDRASLVRESQVGLVGLGGEIEGHSVG